MFMHSNNSEDVLNKMKPKLKEKEQIMSEEANKDYERYLERYCKMYGYTREEAEKHQIVKDVKEYYEKGRVFGGYE